MERYLITIGEAANQLPDQIKARCPDIDWQQVVDMRNIIVHAYGAVKLEVIWETIQTDLPVLQKAVQHLTSEAR